MKLFFRFHLSVKKNYDLQCDSNVVEIKKKEKNNQEMKLCERVLFVVCLCVYNNTTVDPVDIT